jgi:hypothetical protein
VPKFYSNRRKRNQKDNVKQSGRYLTDMLLCENPKCPSGRKPISEQEAAYLFAKQPLWRLFLWKGSIYICPFCHGSSLIPFNRDFRRA